jgi:predicted phosphodiesterase
MYRALEMMCSGLKNVSFDIPFRALSLVKIQGNTLLLTHGDTEIKLGDPDTQAKMNQVNLMALRESGEIEGHFDGACFGHYHKGRYQTGKIPVLFNGALVPPNGYARSEGYVNERCGQFYFESEAGNLFARVEFLEVGKDQDRDVSLGDMIPSVRF